MSWPTRGRRWTSAWRAGVVVALAGLSVPVVLADPPAVPNPAPAPAKLPLNAAIIWALEHNPELAALRQQHGIAAAGVVIARTYPFNPVWSGNVLATDGPSSAGITNRVATVQRLSIDLEVRGQGKYRREAAGAALTRTDWEIAFQETSLAIRVVRAFETVLYRREKLQLVEDIARLNQQVADQVAKLVREGQLRGADLILARSEVDDTLALVGSGRSAAATARAELNRALGVVDGPVELAGALDDLRPVLDLPTLEERALAGRADLRARQAALGEAEARLRLAVADRYGNPNVGPAYEYNETRVNFIGAEFAVPLPFVNTHRGEILQREAERTRAALDLRQTEVAVHHDVEAAVRRLEAARASVEVYQKRILPNLQASLKEMEQLFREAIPGADVLRVIDIRRKLARARDGYLDALYEFVQARADLAAAIGDPALAVPPAPAPGHP